MAMDAESGFYLSDALSLVLAMTVVAPVGSEGLPLLCKLGFQKPRSGMPVVGPFMTADAGFVVHRCEAHSNQTLVVKPHERLGVVSHLLSECAGRFFVAGVAFEVFMGGVHGA